eukprot:CAMPEP_0197582480 /NCGR_PEP_ID=MMETSP1326-20131121/5686_1 /TAXON_ID=1155430 /ORGANISM="Genus nov. species nov., Strain RCC2288" /LENGTH=371 /DNA_ID=CAMNT_0043146565 /DNA_START=265 /DNA_END=1376 /DNA_ORIENTATION=-
MATVDALTSPTPLRLNLGNSAMNISGGGSPTAGGFLHAHNTLSPSVHNNGVNGGLRSFRDDVDYYQTSQHVSPRRLPQYPRAIKTTGTTSGESSGMSSPRLPTPSLANRLGAMTAKRPQLQASPTPVLPAVLHFESWWTESTQTGEPFQGIEVARSQERQYMVLQFHPATRTFWVQGKGLATHTDLSELTPSRTTPLRYTAPMETTVLDRAGRPLEQWDLHVGAELKILGRTVTLRKCSGETMRWLDYQARRLLRTKIRAEKELSKFCFVSFAHPHHVGLHAPLDAHVTKGLARKDPYVAHQAHHTEVPLGGLTHLRSLHNEVEYLIERLSQYRPLKPVDKDVDFLLTKASETAAALAAASVPDRVRYVNA